MTRVAAALAIVAALSQPAPSDRRSMVAERVTRLTRDSAWKPIDAIPVTFRTYHPQGLIKIGDTFFASSVEIRARTQRLAPPLDRYDRDPGEGVGHLFKFDAAGKLVADLVVGEGSVYHPGGIDFDGTHIWMPVAEYRPNSRTIVYRVDPAAMKAAEVFRFGDHIGAIVHNTDDDTLHGVSWGSRRFYRWPLGRNGIPTNAAVSPEALRTINPSHYLDYQDCKYVGRRRMLCTGVTELHQPPTAAPFRLGGIELVDLAAGRPIHQVPLLLWTKDGIDMTHNPVWIEPSASGLRGYFMPEDDQSTVYVYETETSPDF